MQCSFFELRQYKIVYRRYASLFFMVGVDQEEVSGLFAAWLHMVHILAWNRDTATTCSGMCCKWRISRFYKRTSSGAPTNMHRMSLRCWSSSTALWRCWTSTLDKCVNWTSWTNQRWSVLAWWFSGKPFCLADAFAVWEPNTSCWQLLVPCCYLNFKKRYQQ